MNGNVTGSRNVATGHSALNTNQTKSESTAVGYYSMAFADPVSAAPVVSYNTAIGAYSLQGSATPANNTGTMNTALGHSALKGMTSGSGNIGIGYNAGTAITTGSYNVVIGSVSAGSIATSSNNVLIADGQGNEKMRITSTGNVGIGTANPIEKLAVSTLSNNYGLTVTDGGFRTFGVYLNSVSPNGVGVGTKTGYPLYFFTNNNTSTAAMLINTSGNVGIGTSSPTQALQVSGTIRANGLVNTVNEILEINAGITLTDSTNAALELSSTAAVSDAGAVRLTMGETADSFISLGKEVGGSAKTDYLFINNAGYVGIGTANPATKLQVAGVISPSTDNTYALGDPTLRFTAVYAVNGAIQTSDARQKTNIQNSDLGLDFINKLRPVSYNWKAGPDTIVHYGLIAQETESAVNNSRKPSSAFHTPIVDHDEKSDRYGLRYTELISPVIKAVQELYQAFVGVDARVQKLEAENAAKDKELKALKAYLCTKDPAAAICK